MKNSWYSLVKTHKRLLDLAVSLLVTLLFAVLLLNYFILHSGFKAGLLKESAEVGVGAIQSLPPEIVSLANLLAQSSSVAEFGLHGKLLTDPFLFQRAIEFLYPIRYSQEAKNIFVLNGDELPVNCIRINQNETVSELQCP